MRRIFSVAAFPRIVGGLPHGNLALRLGPLDWIFRMSALHRWHHSKVMEEANTNYGTNRIVWDIVFGARFLPESEPAGGIGISEPAGDPKGFVGPMLAPFRWRRLAR